MRIPSFVALLTACAAAQAQITQTVVDIPTRPGVTQRILVYAPPKPVAAVLLFAGGDGGLAIKRDGTITRLNGNFLVRSRELFPSSHQMMAVLVDAPSDGQTPPYLLNRRHDPLHVTDVKAVIAWVRKQAIGIPVWLIGTSRGTQSVAWVASQAVTPREDGGPDGIVLTSTLLKDSAPRRAVPDLPVDLIRVPVLVTHHKQDGCSATLYADLPPLMAKLNPVRESLMTVEGGETTGNPCQGSSYHGFYRIEREVIKAITGWMMQP